MENPNSTQSACTPSKTSSEVSFEVPLKELTDLGVKAKGVTITQVEIPKTLKGLPPVIPLAIEHGEQPKAHGFGDLFERYRLHPARKKGTAIVQTLESFVSLTGRHKTNDTAIFANMDWKAPSLTAVIDYHPESGDEGPSQADNCTHRIHYAFPQSQMWREWVDNDGVKMSQADFAMWIEDHIIDLASPDAAEIEDFGKTFHTTVATPAELLDLSRGLQVNVSSRMKNAKTLSSGETQIVFEESHETTDKNGGELKVPGIFILSIPPFFLGETIRIPVRLRYRAAGGQISWFYQLYRPDLIITDAISGDIVTINSDLNLPVYQGKPEISA